MDAIVVKNLRKEYAGFTLRDCSLTLPAGCVMGLIGENGAGKSTVIRCLLHMIERTAGDIFLLGKNIDDKDFDSVKESVGVVLDEAMFPPVIHARQLNRILKNSYKNWEETLYFSYSKKFSLPEKLPFSKYSKGMKMKLSIAAALSHRAKLLILDEATSGLDPVVRDEILDIFNDFTRENDCSILISSHIVSDLEKICDYIAFLHQGELLCCEEKDRLLEKYGLIHCTKADFSAIPAEAVIGKKESPYGIEALVLREKISADLAVSPVGIEDIFLYFVKFGK